MGKNPFRYTEVEFSKSIYTGWVKAITDDPVGVDLCTTKVNLSWYDYGSTIGFKSHSISPWAANPSSLGTHWYVDRSSVKDPYLYYGIKNLIKKILTSPIIVTF
ncbi:hypothetical protein JQN58_15495 [Aneurinibacillus sp. BA2021]|nr:hypothetical protein [Aneurinibacillus sp. BA2021]